MAYKGFQKIKSRLTRYFDFHIPRSIRHNILLAAPFWVASLMVGIVAVLYTLLFGYAESWLHQLLSWQSAAIFIITPACFLLAWLIVRLFAPPAGGSGIPQVMAAIELSGAKHGDRVNRLLSFRILVVKILSSVLMVFGGGAVGREGPTIQIAGSIFRMVNSMIPKNWPKLSGQQFILTGAAAGLAAAFNTPLGGIIFAIEELARAHIRYFRTALFTAVIIAGLAAQGILGPYLYLGYPDVSGLPFSIFWAVALTAVAGGLLGSFMCKLILIVMKWKRNFSTTQTIMYIICAGLLIAGVAFYFNTAILGSGKQQMSELLFTANKNASWDDIASRIAGPVLAFNTGASGGIFAPSLASGATSGAFIAGLFNFDGASANIIILSGMVGFLTGVTRTPFTSAILVLEMTDRHGVIFHLMVAGLISSAVALLVEKKSLYEILKEKYIREIENDK